MTYKLPTLPEQIFIPSGLGFTKEDMQAYAIAAIEAQGVPDGWSHAGHFYNLVMHALMDVGANHDGARFRLKEILKELESLASAPPAPQAKPQPLSAEQERALCEAYCNTASDEYFKARPQLDSDVNRRIFYAGHRKAWIEYDAAHGITKE